MLVPFGDQVCQNFSIGFRGKGVAFCLEFVLQLFKVFNDAVMDYHQRVVAAFVRVRVAFGWNPVGGPAGVPDAGVGLNCGHGGQFFFKGLQLALRAHSYNLAGIDMCNSGRIVSSVFKAS